jgi:hypothetical protein
MGFSILVFTYGYVAFAFVMERVGVTISIIHG